MSHSRRLLRALHVLGRGWRLRCPRCGARTLFQSWLAMHQRCASCGLRFEREQGYFLGAMYVNYACTVGIILVGHFVLTRWAHLTLAQQLALWISVSILLPLLLFRRTRGLWLSFDYLFHPSDDRTSEHDERRDDEQL